MTEMIAYGRCLDIVERSDFCLAQIRYKAATPFGAFCHSEHKSRGIPEESALNPKPL